MSDKPKQIGTGVMMVVGAIVVFGTQLFMFGAACYLAVLFFRWITGL